MIWGGDDGGLLNSTPGRAGLFPRTPEFFRNSQSVIGSGLLLGSSLDGNESCCGFSKPLNLLRITTLLTDLGSKKRASTIKPWVAGILVREEVK